jgi:hypothetical protein
MSRGAGNDSLSIWLHLSPQERDAIRAERRATHKMALAVIREGYKALMARASHDTEVVRLQKARVLVRRVAP